MSKFENEVKKKHCGERLSANALREEETKKNDCSFIWLSKSLKNWNQLQTTDNGKE